MEEEMRRSNKHLVRTSRRNRTYNLQRLWLRVSKTDERGQLSVQDSEK